LSLAVGAPYRQYHNCSRSAAEDLPRRMNRSDTRTPTEIVSTLATVTRGCCALCAAAAVAHGAAQLVGAL
jgi:hypothetical protein